MTTTTIPSWWIETERLMSAADPSFAHRPQQAAAARVLDRAFRSRTHAALDLPTGSGKTLLALAAAEQAKGRTVISTATKALQNQIRDIDEPTLRAAGVLTRSVVILEGRSNFVCLNRAIHEKDRIQVAAKKTVAAVIKHLRKHPDAARRDQIPVAIQDWVWARICSDSDACDALDCSNGAACAYTVIREAARSAAIVVVNHSLLLADATIKGGRGINWGKASATEEEKVSPGVLKEYQHLIIDEAHALENAAESFGEQRVTIRGIQSLMTRVSKHEHSGAVTKHLAACLDELQTGMLGLPTGALLAPTGKEAPVFTPAADAAKEAAQALRDRSASSFTGDVATEILVSACYSLARKLESIDLALRTGSDAFGPRAVSVEAPSTGVGRLGASESRLAGRGGGSDFTGIKSQLVDVAPWLKANLFNMVPTVAMSGTLAVPGRRDWIVERIGLDAKVEALPTSFDLRAQRLVYVTPRTEVKGAAAMARSTEADVEEIRCLIEASNGRALILFPAMTDLKFVASSLKTSHRVLAQGVTPAGGAFRGDASSMASRGFKPTASEFVPMSNAALAEEFAKDTHSVLLATRSFFEGVDFPGATCSLVIIVRFPNLRPDDPLTLARRRHIESRGGSGWVEYSEPAMQLIFRQAAGRVIRRVTDRGVVAVIDPRSGSKGYAKTALRSLAPSDYTDSLEAVGRFLA